MYQVYGIATAVGILNTTFSGLAPYGVHEAGAGDASLDERRERFILRPARRTSVPFN